MKKLLISLSIIVMLISFSYKLTKTTIYDFFVHNDYEIINNALFYKKENTKENYSNSVTYLNVDEINDEEEMYSMFYTILNNGYDIYTFKCNYNCDYDLNHIDSLKLSLINQLITPNNSYKEIKTTYTTDNKVTINITKKYTKEDIEKINNEIDRLIVELKLNNYPAVIDKIKIYHDYIANKNSYDSEMAQTGDSNYHSNTAIGPLFEGKAICDGYSDAMSFFLDKLNLENIKITNDDHVWNAVKLDDTWYHIDLTWDDPIYTSGTSLTTHDYFMLTTQQLMSKNEKEHEFDSSMYNFVY